jgi:hypothetical protein
LEALSAFGKSESTLWVGSGHFTVLTGTDGCTSRSNGDDAISVIGAKSLPASYGSLANNPGFIVSAVSITPMV